MQSILTLLNRVEFRQIVGEPNLKKCIIKGDNWSVKGPTKNLYIWAHLRLCTVGSYASLSVHLSACPMSLDQNSWLRNNSYLKQHSSWHVSKTYVSTFSSIFQVYTLQITPCKLQVCQSKIATFCCLQIASPPIGGIGRWAHFNVKLHFFSMLRWFGAAFFQMSGNIMGCHRHPVLFWVQLGYFNFCENNVNGSP